MFLFLYVCVSIFILLTVCSLIRRQGDDITLGELIGGAVLSLIPGVNLIVLIFLFFDTFKSEFNKVVIKGKRE